MAASDAKTLPVKNVAYRVTFPILDADGDLVTGATGLDSEVSKDGGTFTDCTNEATEIATSSGMYFLDLTSSEMNADTVAVIVKTSSSGAKTTPLVLYPADRDINDLAFPATSGRSMVVDAAGLVDANAVKVGPTGAGSAQTARDIGASVLLSSGTGTGQLDFTSGVVKANLAQILGTALTETAGQIAAGFKQFFNIASPTSTMNAVTSVGAVSGAVGSVTGAVGSVTGNVGGNVTGSVGSVAAGGITAASLASDTITDAKVAADVTIASVTGAVGSVTGNVGGNVVGSVASVTAGVTVTTNNDKTGYGLSAAAVQAIWDALTSALTTVGSIGKLLVDRIDATISSRGTGTALDAAGVRSAVGLASANLDTQLGAIDDYLDTEVAAIKAKTDNLPASPAATGDIPTATQNADALLDQADAIETDVTVRGSLRAIVAAAAAKLSGAATATVTIRDLADSKDRIVASVDSDGTRLSVTRDLT